MYSLSKLGTRIFRNNVGMGWVGKFRRFERTTMVRVNPGDVIIRAARPLHSGLIEGSADLIGWTPLKIREVHVGHTVAAFTSIEVKTPVGAVSAEQKNWAERIILDGGLAGVARSEHDALQIVRRGI